MQVSRTLWIWASLAALALASLILRFIVPRQVEAPASKSVPDLSVTSPLNQPGGAAIGTNAYEVYSGLYRDAHPEPIVIAQDSLTDIPQVDGSCLKPSTAEERELSGAFVAANRQSHRWEKKFSIAGHYTLLSATEAKAAETCIQLHSDGAGCKPYIKVRHVRFLGVPGFDHTQTKALVSVLKKCGEYCGSGGIFVVEKTAGVWRRSNAPDFVRECSWMY